MRDTETAEIAALISFMLDDLENHAEESGSKFDRDIASGAVEPLASAFAKWIRAREDDDLEVSPGTMTVTVSGTPYPVEGAGKIT